MRLNEKDSPANAPLGQPQRMVVGEPAPSFLSLEVPNQECVAIAEIVRKETGQEPTGFAPIDKLGMSNKVLIVSTTSGRLVVRTNSVGHLPKYQKEAWCLRKAHDVGIPVPLVIACGSTAGLSYSISRYIEESLPIDERFDHQRVWTVLGGYAARLNSIPITGCGSEMLSAGRFKHSWEQELGAELAIVFRDDFWRQSGLLSATQVSEVRREIENCALIQANSGVCHWDIGLNNARIRHYNYADIFLLDLEFSLAAPVPHYQLACVAQPHGASSPEMKAFTAGYGIPDETLAEISPDLERLVVLKCMRSVRWAQDRRPEHVVSLTKKAGSVIFSLLET